MGIKIDGRVGDKIIVMSSAQYVMYQADPAAFLSWMERTGKLPEPEKPKTVRQVVQEKVAQSTRTRKRK